MKNFNQLIILFFFGIFISQFIFAENINTDCDFNGYITSGLPLGCGPTKEPCPPILFLDIDLLYNCSFDENMNSSTNQIFFIYGEDIKNNFAVGQFITGKYADGNFPGHRITQYRLGDIDLNHKCTQEYKDMCMQNGRFIGFISKNDKLFLCSGNDCEEVENIKDKSFNYSSIYFLKIITLILLFLIIGFILFKKVIFKKNQECVHTTNTKTEFRKFEAISKPLKKQPIKSESISNNPLKKQSIFENEVNQNKIITTKSGLLVQSYGEKKIADYFTDKDIDFNYDKQITLSFNEPNKNGHRQEWVRPDFYLNEFSIIIEYWGLKGDPDYDDKKYWKERVYAESKTKYISIYKEDLTDLEAKLEKKLKRLGVNL